jgi:hypothetical protein
VLAGYATIALDGIHLDPAAGSFTYSYRPSSDGIFYVNTPE